jgi:hypothetical protein
VSDLLYIFKQVFKNITKCGEITSI